MRIEEYDFGRIVVDGKEYTRDLIIFPDKVRANWWRKEGHLLLKEDIEDVVEGEDKPEVLIIGTGMYGAMEVPEETREYIRSKGVEIIVEKTKRACELFNELKDKKVVAALHLTC